MQSVGSSSEDQGQREGGQAETKASDRQGQRRTDLLGVRKWQRGPGRPGDHLSQKRAFQEGCVPGVTDDSNPAGSVKLLSTPFPAGPMRRSRMRPLDPPDSSSLLESRCQQGLPVDRGCDPFASVGEPTQ